MYYGNNASGALDTENSPKFTLQGALTDSGKAVIERDDDELKLPKGYLDGFTFTAGSSSISVYGDSETDLTGAHIILSGGTNVDGHGTDSDSSKFTLNIGTATSKAAAYKLYQKDSNTADYELLRTDISAAAGWTLATGVDGSLQSNGTGFWEFKNPNSNNNAWHFVISSEAKITAADDGLPVGISVETLDKVSGTTIVFSDSKFNTNHIIFDTDSVIFGSSTKAVHVSGLDVGTKFTVKSINGDYNTNDVENYSVYITADLDNVEGNGLELLKYKPDLNGWTYDEHAWVYDNRNLNAYDSDSTVAAVNFTISADAFLKADSDNGVPLGVTVTADTDTGEVKLIDFSGMENLTKASDTSLIKFGTVPTGDVDGTIHIKGFNSGTTTQTVFTMGEGDNEKKYYVVGLDGESDTGAINGSGADSVHAYELLRVNDNWIRTQTGWKYFNNATPTFQGYADLTIGGSNTDAADGTVRAAEDGSPRGISIGLNSNEELVVTISEGIGTINTIAGDRGSEHVTIQPSQLTFGSGTAVNASGIHILPIASVKGGDSPTNIQATEFDSDTIVNVEIKQNSRTEYRLANLDRDWSNGFELLHNDTVKGWTFNNGPNSISTETGKFAIEADDTDTKRLGSWTYESDSTNVGALTDKFHFDISEAASLGASNATLGIPEGIATIKIGTSNAPGATISSTGIAATYFMFDSDTALNTFLSDTGVHFFNSGKSATFADGDTVTLIGQSVDTDGRIVGADTDTWTFQLKDLNGNAADGFELLRNYKGWELTTAKIGTTNKTSRKWTYTNDATDVALSMTIGTNASLAAATIGAPDAVTVYAYVEPGNFATIAVDSVTGDGNKFYGVSAADITLDTASIGGLVGDSLKTGIHFVGYSTGTTIRVAGDRAGDGAARLARARNRPRALHRQSCHLPHRRRRGAQCCSQRMGRVLRQCYRHRLRAGCQLRGKARRDSRRMD